MCGMFRLVTGVVDLAVRGEEARRSKADEVNL